MATSAPSCANRSAVARPIPRDPPVTSATRPENSRSIAKTLQALSLSPSHSLSLKAQVPIRDPQHSPLWALTPALTWGRELHRNQRPQGAMLRIRREGLLLTHDPASLHVKPVRRYLQSRRHEPGP